MQASHNDVRCDEVVTASCRKFVSPSTFIDGLLDRSQQPLLINRFRKEFPDALLKQDAWLKQSGGTLQSVLIRSKQ